MILKRWVRVIDEHWMDPPGRSNRRKYLATKRIDDGTDEVRFEKTVGFFGGESERTDVLSQGPYREDLSDAKVRGIYEARGWTLHEV